uniref:Family with sequence similarity 117 member Aa n=1 Tax=Astatotilapia calliptera TaxID=8154 RepID=A0A3P8R928_ASTCA
MITQAGVQSLFSTETVSTCTEWKLTQSQHAPDRTTARPPKPTIRRTLSLDAIVGPYLQGQWPKEADGAVVSCVNDKATQVMINISRNPQICYDTILDIPDGHRAPAPAQRCSSGSQSDPSPGPLDPSLLSPSQSPCILDTSLLTPSEPVDYEILCPSPSASLPSFALDPPLLQACSSSPRPNKTYSFQREPPEGCERVRVCEEATLLQSSCPDPNKVNFTPHGGSAFCPVSLLKPLLPSMDLLFRGLSVSPVTGCSGQASPTRHLAFFEPWSLDHSVSEELDFPLIELLFSCVFST